MKTFLIALLSLCLVGAMVGVGFAQESVDSTPAPEADTAAPVIQAESPAADADVSGSEAAQSPAPEKPHNDVPAAAKTSIEKPAEQVKQAAVRTKSAEKTSSSSRSEESPKISISEEVKTPVATAAQTGRQDKIAMLLNEKSPAKPAGQVVGGWLKTGLVTILKLGLVLALAYVTILALKWLSDKREAAPHNSENMQLLETLKLSTGGNLHLVNVRGRTFLVGCTAGQVNLLSDIGESEAPQPDQAASHRFAEYLEKYYTGPKSAGPATRIAGLLRDCTAHLRRSRHRAEAGRVEAGDINES